MRRVFRRYNWLILGIYGLVVDRISKSAILYAASPYVLNQGVSFGVSFGQGTTILVIFAVILLLWVALSEKKYLWLSLFGALGNVLDRFIYGGVIDFIHMGSFPWFNVADFLITLGLVLWAMKQLGLLAE
ncbi:signal peptidase II [Coprothermobacter platensis]|uniref:signal peptidase II n=1 Tax=Coprothermobacter platensis TaxID=108819 RepID=UPI000476242E|nr:signal peptidase II [Coprothermobacter platensis]